jgi:hypothetical protein
MALIDCVNKVDFGEVVICTDDPEKFRRITSRPDVRSRFVIVENWPTKEGWSRFNWHYLSPHIRTSHALTIQWDSWVWDVSMWENEFLEYDYIGAPWWYTDGRNVGNGGFNLRSTRLLRYCRDNRRQLPIDTWLDDDLFSRKYRPVIENDGYRWAPQRLAEKFAFECVRPSPTSRHFGFHACFNFCRVLDRDELKERARIMQRSKYITAPKNQFWPVFSRENPEIIAELAAEESIESKIFNPDVFQSVGEGVTLLPTPQEQAQAYYAK